MFKRIVIIVFVIVTTLLFSGCQGNKTNPSQDNMKVEDVKESETTTKETQQMIVSDEEITLDESENEKNQKVSLGDTVTVDFAEISLNRVSIDTEVYPRDTSGVYMYLPEITGKKYVQLIGELKNTGTSMYEINNMRVEFLFDDKYEYFGYLKADAGVFRAFDYQVDPFESVDIHLIGEIPDEVINSFQKCRISFGFGDSFKRITSVESSNYSYYLDYEKQ